MKGQDKKDLLAEYKERKITGGICAVRNTANGKILLSAVTDIQGYKNRFEFSQATGGCINVKLQNDWNKYSHETFVFEILDELVKKDTQTSKEFSDDIQTLKEIWLERINADNLY